MKMVVLALIIGVVVALVPIGVGAAKPNNQACLGEDISGYAQGGAAFGHFIGTFIAQNSTPGAGNEIQLHLAGLVPDEAIINSCND